MRCSEIDKLLESADYVGNKWSQLCADTAEYGARRGGGGADKLWFSAQHREVFSVEGNGKLEIRRSLLTGKYAVMEIKCVACAAI